MVIGPFIPASFQLVVGYSEIQYFPGYSVFRFEQLIGRMIATDIADLYTNEIGGHHIIAPEYFWQFVRKSTRLVEARENR